MVSETTEPQPIRLFSSDLDGTLLGNPESAQRFKASWEALPHRTRPVLVFNTGRLVDDVCRLVEAGDLPAPDWLIGAVGTQVHDFRQRTELEEFSLHPAEGWDLERIRAALDKFEGVRPQPAEFLTDFKSSWYLLNATPEQLDAIRVALAEAGLDVNVVYSSNRDLDVVPRSATKGGALRWLCERLDIALTTVLVRVTQATTAACFCCLACVESFRTTRCRSCLRRPSTCLSTPRARSWPTVCWTG